jgi:hypothetical protein
MIVLMPVSCCVTATPDHDEHDAPQPPVVEDVLEAELMAAGLFLLGDDLYLSELREGPIFGAHRIEHGEGFLLAAFLDKPARGLGRPQHADEQGDRRYGAHPEHDTPQALDIPSVALRIALTVNAANCPMTIAISLRPVIEPRISNGASSARYTGTTVEAPPTASPRTIVDGMEEVRRKTYRSKPCAPCAPRS